MTSATARLRGIVRSHLDAHTEALEQARVHADRIEAWGSHLSERLRTGGRLLVAGNGGSAAEAQHLVAELVGRYREDRPAFSAIALTTDPSCVTALSNDYGFDQVFARQVQAHARAGDIVLLLSTSGNSRNLSEAARAAASIGATTWAMTGPGPNPLSTLCDEAICFTGPAPHVQEVQLVAIHAICEVFDAACLPATHRAAPDEAERAHALARRGGLS